MLHEEAVQKYATLEKVMFFLSTVIDRKNLKGLHRKSVSCHLKYHLSNDVLTLVFECLSV